MIKKHLQRSLLSKTEISNTQKQETTFQVSLRHIDKNQGQKFSDWETDGILAQALDTLAGYCQKPLNQQFNEKFTVYGDFPPSNKTDFTHPKHVPIDAKWARIHITGKQILAGHIFENTFFLVFLDKEHRFYKSELKHT